MLGDIVAPLFLSQVRKVSVADWKSSMSIGSIVLVLYVCRYKYACSVQSVG